MEGVGDNIDLNLLVALDVMLEEQNMARATRRLGVSRQTLTRRLNLLRKEFGDKLLVPGKSGMVMTKRARELQSPLNSALEAVRATLIPRDAESCTPLSGALTLSASDYSLDTVVAPLVRNISEIAPNIFLNIKTLDHSNIGDQLENGEVDTAICSSRIRSSGIKSKLLFEDKLRLIARKKHPSVSERLSPEAYRELGRVVYQPIGTDISLNNVNGSRVRSRIQASSPSFAQIKSIVSDSDLVALIPERLVTDGSDSLQILNPPEKVSDISISANWHESSQTNPLVRWVCDELIEMACTIH